MPICEPTEQNVPHSFSHGGCNCGRYLRTAHCQLEDCGEPLAVPEIYDHALHRTLRNDRWVFGEARCEEHQGRGPASPAGAFVYLAAERLCQQRGWTLEFDLISDRSVYATARRPRPDGQIDAMRLRIGRLVSYPGTEVLRVIGGEYRDFDLDLGAGLTTTERASYTELHVRLNAQPEELPLVVGVPAAEEIQIYAHERAYDELVLPRLAWIEPLRFCWLGSSLLAWNGHRFDDQHGLDLEAMRRLQRLALQELQEIRAHEPMDGSEGAETNKPGSTGEE